MGLRLDGSTVPRYGAASPTARMMTRHASPATIVGWRRRIPRRAGGEGASRGTSTPSTPGSVADAGVEEDIEDVDEEVQEHVDARDDQDDALDHRVVAPHDGVDGEPPDAGEGEDALRHDRASYEEREAHADDGHDGKRRRLQRVSQEHTARGEALGKGRAHVVLAEHPQHARPSHPRDERHVDQRQGGGGEDQVTKELPRPVREGLVALHGKRPQADREYPHEEEAEPEYGHGEARHGEDHDGAIDPGALPPGSPDAERHRERDGDDQCQDGEGDRGANALRDEGGDRQT